MGRLIKNILGLLERLLFFRPSPRGLFVINYHGTPETVLENVAKHLEYYSKNYLLIGPETFEDICRKGSYPQGPKPLLLLTFDDGMENNRHVLSLLEKKDIRAFFFVIPAFIDAPDPENYLATVIRPGYSNSKETAPEDFRPMDWDTLRTLLAKGHRIGSHTYSHSLAKEDDEEKSIKEIVYSRQLLEEKLSAGVPYFCSINNTAVSVGPLQEQLIRAHYSFHFTTFYGNNYPSVDPLRIERINVEAYWNMNEVRYALGNIRKTLIKT